MTWTPMTAALYIMLNITKPGVPKPIDAYPGSAFVALCQSIRSQHSAKLMSEESN